MPLDTLLEDIAANTGTSTLPLASSQCITSQDAEDIGTAIAANPRITSVRTGDIRLTPRAAANLFQFFLTSSRVHKLRMPVWSAVYHASQRPLMHLEEEFSSSIEYHNQTQDRNLALYKLFQRMNGKNFICKSTILQKEDGKVRQVEVETTHYIPEVTLETYLKPFLVAPKKTFIG